MFLYILLSISIVEMLICMKYEGMAYMKYEGNLYVYTMSNIFYVCIAKTKFMTL